MKAQKMKTAFAAAITACAAVSGIADLPEVTDMTVRQVRRTVTIEYSLTQSPAVVTLDVQTNGANGWVSIGGEHIQNFTEDSDVFRIVGGKSRYSIKWRPDLSWPGHRVPANNIRAVLTAWETNAPPDYMVVDLTTVSTNAQAYYPAEEFLPGGLLGNDDYRTTKIVMRRIHAKNVEWTMGSVNEVGRTAANEIPHLVTLSNDYYIGVFPVTQTQWFRVMGTSPSVWTNEAYKAMRPADNLAYNDVRCSPYQEKGGNVVADTSTYWPNAPHKKSFLGVIRRRTSIDFDMPSEAQWEFACRAGNGEGKWGDGSAYSNEEEDPNLPGRYKYNGGLVNGTDTPDRFCSTDNATAAVGSYGKNSWGIYDMHGNVAEWCNDYWIADRSSLKGAVNISADGQSPLIGSSSSRAMRGGAYNSPASGCRSAWRAGGTASYRSEPRGVRLVCMGSIE